MGHSYHSNHIQTPRLGVEAAGDSHGFLAGLPLPQRRRRGRGNRRLGLPGRIAVQLGVLGKTKGGDSGGDMNGG